MSTFVSNIKIENSQCFFNDQLFEIKLADSFSDYDQKHHNVCKMFVDLSLSADLDFSSLFLACEKVISKGGMILWDIHLDFPNYLAHMRFEGLYNAHFLSLQIFVNKVLDGFADKTFGVILFSGPLDLGNQFEWTESDLIDFQEWLADLYKDPVHLFGQRQCEILGGFSSFSNLTLYMLEITPFARHLKHLYQLNMLCAYLHRLAASLPDSLCVFASMSTKQFTNLGFLSQLLSKERFAHITFLVDDERVSQEGLNIAKNGCEIRCGVCFPNDEQCTESSLLDFHEILSSLDEAGVRYNVIPEFMLTSSWNGLDHLIYSKQALSPQGKRILQGFFVAGGNLVASHEMIGFDGERSLNEFLNEKKGSG